MPFGASFPSPPTIFPIYILPSIPFRRRRRSSTSNPSSPSISASSPSSSNASSPRTSPSTPHYLSGSTSHLRCARCLTDLCLTSQIISKGFTGRHGRAYLVAPPPATSGSNSGAPTAATLLHDRDAGNLPNTHTHKPVPRQLVTGAHTVCDISCALCGAVLGWKYLDAEEDAQKYKVGKFILETKRVCRGVDWENGAGAGAGAGGGELEGAGVWTGEDARWGAAERGRKNSVRSYDPGNDEYDDDDDTCAIGGDEDVEFDSEDEDECEDLFTGIWTPQLARKRRESRGFSI